MRGVGGGRETHTYALLCTGRVWGFPGLFRVADPDPFCRQAEECRVTPYVILSVSEGCCDRRAADWSGSYNLGIVNSCGCVATENSLCYVMLASFYLPSLVYFFLSFIFQFLGGKLIDVAGK